MGLAHYRYSGIASSSWRARDWLDKTRLYLPGWGPQRRANGELTSRAIAMLPILTGNVGINGGNSGARAIDLYHHHRTDAAAGKPGKNADLLL